jgi:hypothetical protein
MPDETISIGQALSDCDEAFMNAQGIFKNYCVFSSVDWY